MANAMPAAYDPSLYPNLMRYRNPQPAIIIPPPRFNNGIPRHPLELLPDGEWRRCSLCRCTKLCVVLGRCVIWGKKTKVVFPQQ